MKICKILFYLFVLLCLVINEPKDFCSYNKNKLKQEEFLYLNKNVEIENDLKENIDNQLKDIDFDSLNNLIDNLGSQEKSLIKDNTFLSLVKSFINGENFGLYENFFSYALNIIFENILNILPYILLIIGIALIYSMLGKFSSNKTKSTANLIHIISFSAIATIVLKLLLIVVGDVTLVVNNISNQMEVVFPILLTIINALGSVVTVTTFQPLLAVLSTSITKLITVVLIPIFISSVIFGVVGNISKNIRLEKFSKFFDSLFKWIVGIVFTIFIAFLTIQGLTTSSIDSISLKTAKYTIKNYVPILGSYLSDGVSLILASSVLIKNAIGATGLILILVTIFIPIFKIIILILLFKLVSAILEAISDDKISNFLFNISKSLNMLSVCLLAVGFMFLISISILMCCSNII